MLYCSQSFTLQWKNTYSRCRCLLIKLITTEVFEGYLQVEIIHGSISPSVMYCGWLTEKEWTEETSSHPIRIKLQLGTESKIKSAPKWFLISPKPLILCIWCLLTGQLKNNIFNHHLKMSPCIFIGHCVYGCMSVRMSDVVFIC